MKELECPYCETMNSVPDDCYEQDCHFEKECSSCEKTFGFTISYIPYYSEYKVPCANGESHDYKQIVGAPREYFIGKKRCSYCGDETQENKLTFKSGIYYLDGYPFDKVPDDLKIKKYEEFVGEANLSCFIDLAKNESFKIYRHLGIMYMEGKTMFGNITLEARHPNEVS